jgi:hypothetical protein
MELITRVLAGVVAAWIPLESNSRRHVAKLLALASQQRRSRLKLICQNRESVPNGTKPLETRL